MAKINVLDRKTAELIAAGEVVERPSSAVKELLENCIDSGASAVTVEIKNGGTTFIRVTDNGCGIEKDDIKNAFLRHATSKIKTAADLDAIFTLGFRGEALASIAAVSKVELITKTAAEPIGTKYEIHGGDEVYFDDAGCAQGTTIIVRDLFYNTPARQKFLKKDTSEANAVTAVLERIALSHPEISFRLIKDGKQTMLTPGDNKLKSAIYAVLGRDFSQTLLECDYELDGIKVSGYITKPELSRKNSSMQFFFLNGRFIKTVTGTSALKQAYKNEIMTDRFPGCVLNIQMECSLTDVNVHPAKIEVRFSDENRVFHAVYYAVKNALSKDNTNVSFENAKKTADLLKPVEPKFVQLDMNSAPPEPEVKFNRMSVDDYKKEISKSENLNTELKIPIPPSQTLKFADSASSMLNGNEIVIPQSMLPNIDIEYEESSEPVAPAPVAPSLPQYKIIGEAFMTYIIVEFDGKLLFIDKHAAHERILFEELTTKAEQFEQQLLLPVEIELNSNEFDVAIENIDGFKKLGFEIEECGIKSILVRSVPMTLGKNDVKEVVLEAVGKLTQGMSDMTPDFIEWLYHSMSCRAAIKGGEKTDISFLDEITKKVLTDNNIKRCPHGRPIVVEMTVDEIKRRFGRI